MKKIIIISIVLLSAVTMKAQVGIGLGYTSEGHAMTEVKIWNNDVYYNLSFSTTIPRGIEGTEVTAMPETERIESGNYMYIGYFGVGFNVWNDLYLIPKAGGGKVYQYDIYEGAEKVYTTKLKNDFRMSFGIKAEYFLTNKINIGLEYNTISGGGLTMGYFF
jgi:hypothetical protein